MPSGVLLSAMTLPIRRKANTVPTSENPVNRGSSEKTSSRTLGEQAQQPGPPGEGDVPGRVMFTRLRAVTTMVADATSYLGGGT